MARRSAWGSIQAAGPGIWRLRYPLPNDPSTGKRRQGYETVHGTKKDASKRLAELRIEHDRFRVSPAVMTVSRLWGQHYSKHIERLAPSTVEGYESAYRTAIEPTFGERELDSIRKAEVQEWLDGMTYGSAKKALAVFRAMFSFAVDNDMCNESPFTKRYQLPPKPQKSSREVSESVHTEAELAAILADARGGSAGKRRSYCRRSEGFAVRRRSGRNGETLASRTATPLCECSAGRRTPRAACAS